MITPDALSPVPPAVEARGITKRFAGVVANDAISFAVSRGEVHALLGENGSGKTTLCKILTGLYRPDEGFLEVDGFRVRFASPADAYASGIFMVQQHFSLVESLTVAENVVLGWTRRRSWRFAMREVVAEVAATAAEFQIDVDPTAYVWQLSVGERQRVEILKALYRGARTLILDEPTTVLTPQECERLFASLRQMAASGNTIIFISHKLAEVIAFCDRVTVLRHGRVVDEKDLSNGQFDARRLASIMVGRDVVLARRGQPTFNERREPILSLENVSACNKSGRVTVDNVSLDVYPGEIVGIAGVAGNGQHDLAEVVAGVRPRTSGSVKIGQRALPNGSPRAAIERGMAYVPQDRRRVGLALRLSVAENILLKSRRDRAFWAGPFLKPKRVRARSNMLLHDFDVRGRPESRAGDLSGGNAQKVVLARELSSNPRVVVAESPTRGLDVGATQSVRQLLLDAARRQVGVLLFSEDLDEVMDLSDRIVVMFRGRIVGEFESQDADRERIGLLMAGIGA